MVMRVEESLVAPASMPSSSTSKIKPGKQWEEVEVTSCFRTGGSMPIPKTAVVIPVYTVQRDWPKRRLHPPPKKRVTIVLLWRKELPQHHAEEETLPELKEERLIKLKVPALPEPERLADGMTVEEECNKSAVVFSVTTNLSDPPPPPPRVQQCKKHSRCHCDDFSLGSNNFFDVVPQA